MSKILREVVESPLGRFTVSTIRTAGGGGATEPSLASMMGFTMEDYADLTAWPFETMVFREGSSVGLYHAAFDTEEEARAHHALMVETVRKGLEFGGGVEGPQGNPTLTPEEWRNRKAAKVGA